MTMLISSGVAGAQSPAACGVIAAGRAAIPPSSGLGPSSFALSADGATLAFADPDGRTLVVRDVSTGTETRFARPRVDAINFPSLSGDGRLVAWAWIDERCGRGGCFPLSKAFVGEVASGRSAAVSPGRWSWYPVLSEAGGHLIYATEPGGDVGPDTLIRRDLRTGREVVAAGNLEGAWYRIWSVSPHGGKVAFEASLRLQQPAQVHLHRVADGTTRPLTRSLSYPASKPRFLSDGQRLTFESQADIGGANPAHEYAIYLRDLRSGTTTRLPRPGWDAQLSGNGRRMAYTSSDDSDGANPEGNPEVFSLDLQTGMTTQLTSSVDGSPRVLATSRDGGRVLFISSVDSESSTLDLAVATLCPAPATD